jgi:hypothetical protein
MTTRRWTLVVVAVALLLTVGRLAERRADFLSRAEVWASRADDLTNGRMCLDVYEFSVGYPKRLRDYWLSLARKYERAARRPWLAVEHDSSEPERFEPDPPAPES